MSEEGEVLADYIVRAERCLDGIDDAREDLKALLTDAKARGYNADAIKSLAEARRRDKTGQKVLAMADWLNYARAMGDDISPITIGSE